MSKQNGPLGEEFSKTGNKRTKLPAEEFLSKLREASNTDIVYTPVEGGTRLSICVPEDEVFHTTYMPPEQEDFDDFEAYIAFVREVCKVMDSKGTKLPEIP